MRHLKIYEQFYDPFDEEEKLGKSMSDYMKLVNGLKLHRYSPRPQLINFEPQYITFYIENPKTGGALAFYIMKINDDIFLYVDDRTESHTSSCDKSEILEECSEKELLEKIQKLINRVYSK